MHIPELITVSWNPIMMVVGYCSFVVVGTHGLFFSGIVVFFGLPCPNEQKGI